jgi:hypothetical protein
MLYLLTIGLWIVTYTVALARRWNCHFLYSPTRTPAARLLAVGAMALTGQESVQIL